MTEEQLIAVLAKLSEEFSMDDIVAELKENGVVWHLSYDHATELYDQIWEHPFATEHNKKCGNGAGIMNQYFCTLYRLNPEHHDLRACTQYKFCVGRVGNTSMRNFDL